MSSGPARSASGVPAEGAVSRVTHRVNFHETDAMGIVHHANYLKYLEQARVVWMDEHDRPYREYMARDTHFATTHVSLDYHRPARFDDVLEICVWLANLRGASLRMEYVVTHGDEKLLSAATEHALVDGQGRIQRIPKERREALRAFAVSSGRP